MADNHRREVHPITSRAQWLDMRRPLLTASRIGALFDCHKYLTREQLVAEMRGQSQGDNPAMRRGRVLEPAVAAAVAEEHPDWVLRKAQEFYAMPDHRLGATPDYFADVGGSAVNLQCKTVNPAEWEKWQARPPLHYLLQVACENLVTDASAGVLAVMVTSPSFPLHLFDVPRHEAAERRILDAAAEFWRAWDAGEHPAPQPEDGLAEMLDDGSVVDWTGSNELPGMLQERTQLKAWISGHEKRVAEIDASLKEKIGAARMACLPGWEVTYATSHRKETVIPARDIRTLRIKALNEEMA